ncbi:MAG: metallophosphoesterase [Thermoplasmatota archaeon]
MPDEIWPGVHATEDHCIWMPDHDTVVIADLHLGYEGVLRMDGVAMPRYQDRVIHRRLQRILERYDPRQVVINGDFKHNFSRNLRQEWREVGEMLSFLSGQRDVHLVRGNHDNFLKTIAVRQDVPLTWQYEVGDVTVTHGHRTIDVPPGGRLLLAHEHPFIKLRDEVGATLSMPCYLHTDAIAVMPAFSPIVAGTDVSDAAPHDYLSPLLHEVDVDRFNVTAVSDVGLLDFATIRDLKDMGRQHA